MADGGTAAPLFRRILQKIYEKNTEMNNHPNAVFRPSFSRIRVPAPPFPLSGPAPVL